MNCVIDMNQANPVDNTVTSVDSDSKDMDESTSGATSLATSGAPVHRDEYDWEHLSEPPDAGEIDQRNSDSSDYEETYIKRKTRRKEKKVIHSESVSHCDGAGSCTCDSEVVGVAPATSLSSIAVLCVTSRGKNCAVKHL